MRKESATIRKCHSRLSSLGLDSTVAFHKSKLILKIYRDVVWVLSERAQELQEYAWELGDQDLSNHFRRPLAVMPLRQAPGFAQIRRGRPSA